jgi:hypothetical protein
LALDLAIVATVAVVGELNVWRFDSVAGPRWLTTALSLLLALPLAFSALCAGSCLHSR